MRHAASQIDYGWWSPALATTETFKTPKVCMKSPNKVLRGARRRCGACMVCVGKNVATKGS